MQTTTTVHLAVSAAVTAAVTSTAMTLPTASVPPVKAPTHAGSTPPPTNPTPGTGKGTIKGTTTGTGTTPTTGTGTGTTPTTALQFYQISNLLKCPVIGVCLSFAEQRKLVRKAGMCLATARPFDIHELLVNMTSDNNFLARQAQALLRKKFELRAAPLRKLDAYGFMQQWDAAFAAQDYAMELWTAATRPDLPPTLHRHIFGCVHMDMHDALADKHTQDAQVRLMRLERAGTAEKMRNLKTSHTKIHKELRLTSRERDALLRQKDLLHAENQTLKATLTTMNATPHAPKLALELELALELKHKLQEAQLRIDKAEQGRTLAMEEAEVQRTLVQTLQQELLVLLCPPECCTTCAESCTGDCAGNCASDGASPCAENCAENCSESCVTCPAKQGHCPSCVLCPRRVLMVGGMTRMESLYRQVVEAKGDAFEYHDGYLGGVNNLETSLQKADIVLCPVSCNSHRACLLVKSLYKKYKKTVHMMPSFSLSAVSRVIARDDDSPAPLRLQKSRAL